MAECFLFGVVMLGGFLIGYHLITPLVIGVLERIWPNDR